MTISTRTYRNKNGYDVVFKRIRIDVEPVRQLIIKQFGGIDDTNKPFIGEIDDGEGTFKLRKANPSRFFRFMEGNFFLTSLPRDKYRVTSRRHALMCGTRSNGKL
jgi:hypothetical protein